MSEDYLKLLAENDVWNHRHIMTFFGAFGIPDSYTDFGCGTGAMVQLATKIGVDAMGIDIHDYEAPWYHKANLERKFKMEKQSQLVTCLEVAEHIHPQADITFVETVAKHVRVGGLLVFSAAHPGQEGEDHVNTRSAIYWRTKFHNQCLNYQIEQSTRLAMLWSNINSPLYWLAANVMVFNK